MKFTAPILVFLILSCSPVKPQLSGYIFDHEDVLTTEQESYLDSLFRSHEEKTTNQIILVSTPDYDGHVSLMQYAVDFGNKMGIGLKEKDNGVVIMYSNAKREVRISTGYGTEEVLKDEIAKRIIDEIMIPEFRNGDTYSGLKLGSEAIISFLEQPENKIE